MAEKEMKRGAERYRIPRVDIREERDSVTLRAEMPGVNKEDLDISIEGDELSIVGKTKPVDAKLRLIHGETSDGDFSRTFVLGEELDPSNVKAKLDNGVLTLTIHKRKELSPKKISVEAK